MPTTYAIPNGRTVMDATLYTGTSAAQNITNQAGFKPDLVWTKSRNNAVDNCLIDSVRGTSIALKSNLSNAEDNAGAPYYVTSFNTNGFGVNQGTGSGASGYTYVGWQWQAGQGTTSTNTNGSITSTVSANPTAGFSIVTYTGTAANGTIGHGLNTAPQMIHVKARNSNLDWLCYHVGMGNTQFMYLDLTTAAQTSSTAWNNTSPTSTVWSTGSNGVGNANGVSYVAYCWAPVAGFSAFGSYTGNGSTDGPFIYTGFRPKFIMLKIASGGTGNWEILDSSRNTYNTADLLLLPSSSNAESSSYGSYYIDFVSNGFKIRGSGAGFNGSGEGMIYAAFAENPFKYANAR